MCGQADRGEVSTSPSPPEIEVSGNGPFGTAKTIVAIGLVLGGQRVLEMPL